LPAVEGAPADIGREGEAGLVVFALHHPAAGDLFVVEVGDGGWTRPARKMNEVDDVRVVPELAGATGECGRPTFASRGHPSTLHEDGGDGKR
jgi:hypothetical protein